MPGELEKICRMLEGNSPELATAAARVLGELESGEAAVRQALLKGLKSSHGDVQLASLEALARTTLLDAIPSLVDLLSSTGPARDRAVRILASMGPAAARELRARLAKAEAPLRRAILEVMGLGADASATEAILERLADSDPEVGRKAAQALRQRIASMSAGERVQAMKRIVEFMKSPRARKLKSPLVSCLDLLGVLGDASALKSIIRCLDRSQPPAVRRHAIQALGRLPIDKAAGRALVPRLLPLLAEADFNEIVKPALDLLRGLPVGAEHAGEFLALLRGPQPQARLLAARVLGTVGTCEAAGALVESLWSGDQALIEATESALRSNEAFAPILLKALERQKDMPRAWKIVNLVRGYTQSFDKARVKRLLGKCLDLMGRGKPLFQAYFEILRSADPAALRAAVLQEGRRLLAGGKFESADRALRLLQREDLSTPEAEFALAVAQLRRQRMNLAMAGHDQGHAIQLFMRLARRDGFPFLKTLQKEARLVTSAGLLYLGFAFVERPAPERDTGAEILKLSARQFGSREEGKAARQKLRTQGMG